MIANEPNFARLMFAAQNGDKAAAERMLSDVGVWLEWYYSHRVPRHQVDELVQQALITVYAKRAAWDPACPFLQWLTAIAQYRWAEHLEQGYRQCSKELAQGSAGSGADPAVHPSHAD